VAQHIAENTRVFGFTLDPSDLALIEALLAKSHDLQQGHS
jgi:diketogulonate reductase-like aldo/keto reductase